MRWMNYLRKIFGIYEIQFQGTIINANSVVCNCMQFIRQTIVSGTAINWESFELIHLKRIHLVRSQLDETIEMFVESWRCPVI